MFIGKIIGGIIGFFAFSSMGLWPVGVVIGVIVGHYFDKGRASLKTSADPELRAEIEAAFKSALFPLLGMLAKADGRVCENEISGTERLMEQLGISGELRKDAISLFQKGVNGEVSLEGTLMPFLNLVDGRPDLKQIFIVYLLSVAFADGHLHKEEERFLAEVAEHLGYSRFAFNRLIGMVKAQSHFYQRQHERAKQEGVAATENELQTAYAALGVSANDTDQEIKRAYRKLMSEYHPDKLAGQGVPEEMIKLATERSQEIQSAYDIVKKARQ